MSYYVHFSVEETESFPGDVWFTRGHLSWERAKPRLDYRLYSEAGELCKKQLCAFPLCPLPRPLELPPAPRIAIPNIVPWPPRGLASDHPSSFLPAQRTASYLPNGGCPNPAPSLALSRPLIGAYS